MAEPEILRDDWGDLITVEADVLGCSRPDETFGPPSVLVTFHDGTATAPVDFIRMRLSGERLAAFTEAVDRAAAHLAALASGSDDE